MHVAALQPAFTRAGGRCGRCRVWLACRTWMLAQRGSSDVRRRCTRRRSHPWPRPPSCTAPWPATKRACPLVGLSEGPHDPRCDRGVTTSNDTRHVTQLSPGVIKYLLVGCWNSLQRRGRQGPEASDRSQRDYRDRRGDDGWACGPRSGTGDGRSGVPRPSGGRQFDTRYDSQALQPGAISPRPSSCSILIARRQHAASTPSRRDA